VLSLCCVAVLFLGASGHVQNVAYYWQRGAERHALSERNNAYNEAMQRERERAKAEQFGLPN
jgi:hypothetical protein